MNVDEYYIIPIELSPKQLADTERRLHDLNWTPSSLLGSADSEPSAENLVTDTPRVHLATGIPIHNNETLHVALVDTCLCFIYHRHSSATLDAPSSLSGWTEALLERRTRTLESVVDNLAVPPIRRALKELGAHATLAYTETYGFSVYVLTLEPNEQAIGQSEAMLDAIRALIGAPAHEEVGSSSPFSFNQQLVKNVDLSPTSAVYASYSAVVGLAQLGPSMDTARAQTDVTHLLLRLQLRLQAAWNRCHQASRRIRMQRAMEITATGWRKLLRAPYHYQSRYELTSFSYASQLVHGAGTPGVRTRERLIFDELVKTSRILNEIDILGKYLEHENQLRLESGQRWISGILALVAGTSTAQALFALSRLTMPWEISLSIGVGCFVLLAIFSVPRLHSQLSKRTPRSRAP